MVKYEEAESVHAKNHEMIDLVGMYCKRCSTPMHYFVHDSCSTCGKITIECVKCEYVFEFGE